MDAILAKLLEEILKGSSSAIIAILIAAIIYQYFEMRALKKDNAALLNKLDEQQKNNISTLMKVQDTFVEKSDQMIDKYHNVVSTSNENSERLKDMLSRLIVLLTSRK